jgi:hypothetical protein
MKIKRRSIAEKYADAIEALYGGGAASTRDTLPA